MESLGCLEPRWVTATRRGRSDENIVAHGESVVLAPSVRQKAENKRWSRKRLTVTGVPWMRARSM